MHQPQSKPYYQIINKYSISIMSYEMETLPKLFPVKDLFE